MMLMTFKIEIKDEGKSSVCEFEDWCYDNRVIIYFNAFLF